ncbi:MAG: hypothetical protein GXX91_17175 [Verrucomicrobiaceae bacterium]|nr:hypothetical protein [Verrucomicrobiaceae bacterium]
MKGRPPALPALAALCALLLLAASGGNAAEGTGGKDKPSPPTDPTDTPETADTPAAPANLPAAHLDIAGAKDGARPAGSTPLSGTWTVHAASDTLRVAPEPILDNWLAFGPEIREKSATILASGRALGRGSLQSRFGAGLYGKNGFQLRFVPATRRIELVRRGVVLLHRPFPLAPEEHGHLELSVRPERNHWIVTGRAWREKEKRPRDTAFKYKIFAVELLFPLAGRSTLFATPYSGEPVTFTAATVYYGEYVETEDPAETEDGESLEEKK